KTTYYKILTQFFHNMGFTTDIPDSILDWVDDDDIRSPNGAETFDYYSTLPRPYRAKNMALDSIEELLMIRTITPEIYYGMGGGNIGKEMDIVDDNMYLIRPHFDSSKNEDEIVPLNERRIGPEKSRALADYIRVYGDRDYTSDLNKININTAPYRVISALTDTMTPDKVTTLLRRRMTKPFAAVSEVEDLIADKEENKPILNETLSVSSQIFSVKATGTYKGTSVTINAVYNRAAKRFYYYGIR
ncbi:MAG TPA: type II secretion system protein GspK, partial [Spirochaetota bacterium]